MDDDFRAKPQAIGIGFRKKADNFSMLQLLEQSPAQLQAWFAAAALPAYRAAQVRRWLFERRATAFDQMTDLPKAVREQLAGEFQIWSTRIAAHRKAKDGTEKLLLDLDDAEQIECVLLRDDRRHCTVCISTQVGCAMHCASAPADLKAWSATSPREKSSSRCCNCNGCWPLMSG